MTLTEMRTLLSMPEGDYTDAQVVAAYADLTDDGYPASFELVEPVSVEQARAQCRIDSGIEDDLIAQKIRAARDWVEDYTDTILMQRTLVYHLRSWAPYLELPMRPVVSVEAIAYTGTDGEATYTDAQITLRPSPARIYPAPGGWPALRSGGAVTIAYTAGYDEGEVPQTFCEAILVLVAGMFEQRDGGYESSMKAAEGLLARKRRVLVG